MGFELFDRQARPLVASPTVTIQRSGNISFNRAAFEALGKPEAIELLYDPTEHKVALRAGDPADHHTYSFQGVAKADQKTFMISGKAFLKHYAIDKTDTVRRDAVMAGDLLVVDLKDAGHVISGNRFRAPGALAIELEK